MKRHDDLTHDIEAEAERRAAAAEAAAAPKNRGGRPRLAEPRDQMIYSRATTLEKAMFHAIGGQAWLLKAIAAEYRRQARSQARAQAK